jgi:hypothetical protein
MDRLHINRLRRALEELGMGLAGSEERWKAGQWQAAVGYLEGSAKAVVRDLSRVLDEIDPPSHPVCMEQISDGLACGEKLVNGTCPEHGERARGYSLDAPDTTAVGDTFTCNRSMNCSLAIGHDGDCSVQYP